MVVCENIIQLENQATAQRARRAEPRYKLPEGRLKAYLTVIPNQMSIPVAFENISLSGARICPLSQLTAEQENALDGVLIAAQRGHFIVSKLDYNDIKIPVHILNVTNKTKYGLQISDNRLLTALIENGKLLFNSIVQGAVRFQTPEATFENNTLMARDSLLEDIRQFVESASFPSDFGFALAKELPSLLPSLEGRVNNLKDALKLAGLFLKFMETWDKDLPFIVGAELYRLQQKESGATLATLLPAAVRNLCKKGSFFASQEERNGVERLFESGHFSKLQSSEFKSLPVKHPVAILVNARYYSFTRQIFFNQSLVPYVRLHYLNRVIPQTSDMVAMIAGDERIAKVLLHRWVQNALNELGSTRDSEKIGDYFKQAMYEYMTFRKSNNITSVDMYDLFNGKLPDQYGPIRDRFLSAACGLIDAPVRKKLEEYKADSGKDGSKTETAKKKESRTPRMTPVELTKRFLWPKIVQLGLIRPLHKEVARAWVPTDKALSIAELGNAVVLSQSAYDEFVTTVLGDSNTKLEPKDFFDVVDLNNIYKRTVGQGGNDKKGVFAIYVDMLHPVEHRDMVLEKVIRSPQWSKFYILNKPASYFADVFGLKSHVMNSMILDNMLTSTPTGEYV
jgi:hypothetical protein